MADTDGEHGIWLVVPPETGLIWLLGTVALIAVAVHALLIGHTKWYPAYWEGGKGKVAIEHVIPHA
ncbi:MAG: light-harvesting protein [Rhodomicrobium sp.]|jgi:light-harvesting protein B-800-850 alpha chain